MAGQGQTKLSSSHAATSFGLTSIATRQYSTREREQEKRSRLKSQHEAVGRPTVYVVSDGQTTMVALIPPAGGADPNRFGPANFKLNADRTACTCSNGVTTTRIAPKVEADGLTARFLASDCQGCPFWNDCRGEDGKPKAQRTVFLSDHHAYLRQAEVFNRTPEGQALLGRRWQVEPTVAWLTRYQGCRQTRCLGQKAVQCQIFQACAMRNLLLWLSRRRRSGAPTHSILQHSPLAWLGEVPGMTADDRPLTVDGTTADDRPLTADGMTADDQALTATGWHWEAEGTLRVPHGVGEAALLTLAVFARFVASDAASTSYHVSRATVAMATA